jgi:Rhodopirellula transposase DDE domain
VEVNKLGHGGIDYIASLHDCDLKTVRRRQHDLEELRAQPLQNIAPKSRANLMERDLYVSAYRVAQLLRDAGYRRRQMRKYLDMGEHPERNAPFENIARSKEQYLWSGNPIVSIDTKKRELLEKYASGNWRNIPLAIVAWLLHTFFAMYSGERGEVCDMWRPCPKMLDMSWLLPNPVVGALVGFGVGFLASFSLQLVGIDASGLGTIFCGLLGAVAGCVVGVFLQEPPGRGKTVAWWSALMAGIVGGVGFLGGFIGPILFRPGSPQGPLLGIFYTGPVGAVVGAVCGVVIGFVVAMIGKDSSSNSSRNTATTGRDNHGNG